MVDESQNDLNQEIELPLFFKSLSSSPTRLRSTLTKDPKYNANTVHVIVMTL